MQQNNTPETSADELAALIDALVASGTQHIDLEIGTETRIRTVNSTDCSKPGACAIPNLSADPEDEEYE